MYLLVAYVAKPLYNIGYHTLKWVLAQFCDTYIKQKKLKRKLKKKYVTEKNNYNSLK